MDRRGYAGPIKLRVEKLPAGVSCPGAAIPEGENVVQLLFQTDGTAVEGVRTVAIVAMSGDLDVDRKNLDLEIFKRRLKHPSRRRPLLPRPSSRP